MPISLHDVFVPSALQMLGTAAHLIDRAEGWCSDTDCSEGEIVRARLHETMLPFAYQIKSVAAHTAGAIAGVRAGTFSPELTPPPADFVGLRAAIVGAREMLDGVETEEMEGMIGQPMRFEMRDFRIDFTAENFLLSFSQPNFYFHAATAYDILRMKGVPLGKRDFMGRMRLSPG